MQILVDEVWCDPWQPPIAPPWRRARDGQDRRAIGGWAADIDPLRATHSRWQARREQRACLSRRGELHGGHRTPDYEVVLQGRAGLLRASAVRGPRPNWITLPAVDCHLAAQTRSLTSRACARIDGNKIPKWGGPPRFPTIFARKKCQS